MHPRVPSASHACVTTPLSPSTNRKTGAVASLAGRQDVQVTRPAELENIPSALLKRVLDQVKEECEFMLIFCREFTGTGTFKIQILGGRGESNASTLTYKCFGFRQVQHWMSFCGHQRFLRKTSASRCMRLFPMNSYVVCTERMASCGM